MPYRRYNKYNRVMSNKQLTKKVKEIQNDEELKHKDTLFAVGEVDASIIAGVGPTVYPIGLVGEGTDARARIGEEIINTSLMLRFQVKLLFNSNETGIAPANNIGFLRMIVFYHEFPDGEIPPVVAVADALLDANSAFSPINMMYDYGSVNAGVYKVLYDKVYTLTASDLYIPDAEIGALAGVPVSRFIKKKIKIGRKQRYYGDDAVIQDLQSNGLFVFWLLDTPNSDPTDRNQLQIDGSIRLYYKDD